MPAGRPGSRNRDGAAIQTQHVAGQGPGDEGVTKEYLSTVRRWSGEVPIGHQVYIALDVLNFALNLAVSKLNQEAGTNAPDEHMRLHRTDVDAGEQGAA